MRYHRLIPCVAILGLVLTASASAQTTLRWKLAKEQKFQVMCAQQTEVTTSIAGKGQKAYLEMTMELAWEVGEVADDGTTTITQSFTRLAIKTTAPQAEAISYDSASAAKPIGAAKEVAAGVAPLIGAKFMVKMDARGDVKEVKLTEEATKALTALPADSQLKQVLSPEGLTQLFRLGGVLPEQAVNAGDTWPVPSQTDTPYGKLSQESTYTFAGPQTVDDKVLQKLSFSSKGTFVPKPDAAVKLDIKEQTKSGEILIDTEGGFVVSADTKLFSRSAQNFRDNVIQVTVESTTKLAIKRQ